MILAGYLSLFMCIIIGLYVFLMLQIERDRLHGKADLGQSAVVYSNKRRRIDVDTDDIIFHLKVTVTHSQKTRHTCRHSHVHCL